METQINKAWKWTIRYKLAEKLHKTFENSETCDFAINIIMGYEFDTEVCTNYNIEVKIYFSHFIVRLIRIVYFDVLGIISSS